MHLLVHVHVLQEPLLVFLVVLSPRPVLDQRLRPLVKLLRLGRQEPVLVLLVHLLDRTLRLRRLVHLHAQVTRPLHHLPHSYARLPGQATLLQVLQPNHHFHLITELLLLGEHLNHVGHGQGLVEFALATDPGVHECLAGGHPGLRVPRGGLMEEGLCGANESVKI